MQVLVTGASGFTGSRVARRLAEGGHSVTGLYRRSTRFLEPLAKTQGITLRHAGDLRSLESGGPFDAVVHAAATSPAPGVDTARLVEDNVVATKALIEAAQRWRARRFIFCSSLSVYGVIESEIVDESTPIVEPDAYGATKHLGELMLRDCADRLPSLSLRLPGILGPGAHRNWMASVAERLRRGESIPAFNIDRPFNNAAHVEDIACLVLGVLERPFEGAHSVVLGAGGVIPIREAIETLAHAMGLSAKIDERKVEKPSFYLSSARAIQLWGYDPLEIRALLKRYGEDVLGWEGPRKGN
jgi:nucleoside-diphosphate-sugar epimerase